MNVRIVAAAVLVGAVVLGVAVVSAGLTTAGNGDTERSADSAARELDEGSTFAFAERGWRVRHDGFGAVTTSGEDRCARIDLRPRSASTEEDTHAALAVTTEPGPGAVRLEMRTVEQIRRADPNAWEVAWLIWAYQDDVHFYYFTVKPNGWELGKADPAYPGSQRFLATGEDPRADVGEWVDVEIRHSAGTMSVRVAGEEVVTFVDEERPYGAGAIGMYTEDAHVQFRPPGC